MSRTIRCPNCGADHKLVNPGISMVVCSYCNTAVYWGDDEALHTGGKSILPETDARLFLGAEGRLGERQFEVVGHVRYDHGRGAWDEWYLQLADGGISWVSEDERKLTLELATRLDAGAPRVAELRPGRTIPVGGIAYTAREIGRARCVGGAGQLPFKILPGEEYIYADLASVDGTKFATLEYDEEARPTCYVGHPLDHDQLSISNEREPSLKTAPQGRQIKCTNCNGPLEIVSGRTVETQVCEYCGAQLDLTDAQHRVLGINPQDFDPQFGFEIGQSGTFEGSSYEVCGRMLYRDDEGYPTREYLLFNPDKGYLWLAEENNHFVLNRPTQEAPTRSPFRLAAKTPLRIGKTTFRFYESGQSTLVYVDGAVPWQAYSGDTQQYSDLIAPPEIFCVEASGEELEYFRGTYLESAEVWRAFGQEGTPPRTYGVHPAQPFRRGAVTKILIAAGAIAALANLALLIWSLTVSGRVVMRQTIPAQQYLQATMSEPFIIGDGALMALSVYAPLANSWISLEALMIDEKENIAAEMDSDVSYYSGFEGGEHWSEGDKERTRYFRAPKPGRYRLALKAAAGSGNVKGPPRGEALQVTLSQGGILSRYFAVALGVTLLFPFFAVLRRYLFEKRRWAAVAEDDDNDSDTDWD
jgi:hypothetical protein